MKFETSTQLAAWLRTEGRNDLANQGVVDVSDIRYLEVFTEVQEQHPQEEVAMLKDRALFRILTHPEWGPTPKQVKSFGRTNRERDRVLFYAWAIAILILLLLLAVARVRGQEKPRHQDGRVVYEAQGTEKIEPAIPAIKMGGGEKQPAPPALTADQKLRVRELQRHFDSLSLQLLKLELDKVKLEKQLSDMLVSINTLAYELAKESKVDPNQWNLNIDTLAWEKRK